MKPLRIEKRKIASHVEEMSGNVFGEFARNNKFIMSLKDALSLQMTMQVACETHKKFIHL